MTRAEWAKALAFVKARWPNAVIPEESFAVWYDDVKGYDAATVRGAIDSLYYEGREWPPNGGQIVARIEAALRPSFEDVARVIDGYFDPRSMPDLPEGLAGEVMQSIGVSTIMDMRRNESVTRMRWELRRAYDALVERRKQRDLPALVVGSQRAALPA